MSTASIHLTPPSQDAFESWWQRDGEWVEPPNLRRGGESGVKRINDPALGLLYLKRQVGHIYRTLLHPLGRPTALRERAALVAIARIGVTVPQLVFCEARRQQGAWRALLVTKALVGYVNIKAWYEQGGRERVGDKHAALLDKIGATLAKVHLHRWQHACLYWKHLFLSTDVTADGLPDVALLDLEKARHLPFATMAARRDMKQLRRRCGSLWNDQEWTAILEGHARVFGRRVL